MQPHSISRYIGQYLPYICCQMCQTSNVTSLTQKLQYAINKQANMSPYLLLNIDYVNHIEETQQYSKINKLRITRFILMVFIVRIQR